MPQLCWPGAQGGAGGAGRGEGLGWSVLTHCVRPLTFGESGYLGLQLHPGHVLGHISWGRWCREVQGWASTAVFLTPQGHRQLLGGGGACVGVSGQVGIQGTTGWSGSMGWGTRIGGHTSSCWKWKGPEILQVKPRPSVAVLPSCGASRRPCGLAMPAAEGTPGLLGGGGTVALTVGTPSSSWRRP